MIFGMLGNIISIFNRDPSGVLAVSKRQRQHASSVIIDISCLSNFEFFGVQNTQTPVRPIPDTPWDCHICQNRPLKPSQCRHIWQSHGVFGYGGFFSPENRVSEHLRFQLVTGQILRDYLALAHGRWAPSLQQVSARRRRRREVVVDPLDFCRFTRGSTKDHVELLIFSCPPDMDCKIYSVLRGFIMNQESTLHTLESSVITWMRWPQKEYHFLNIK